MKMTSDTGNMYYRAPECWGEDPKYSTAADLWGVGIILYEFVSKKKVYIKLTK